MTHLLKTPPAEHEPAIWVADSSPLILLAKIGLLHLAPDMTPHLVVPSDVLDEINNAPPGDPTRQAVAGLLQTKATRVATPDIPAELAARQLGRGETAALAEALQTLSKGLAATVILDDHDARREAKALGIPMIGTVGILIRAKDEGRLSALRPYLHRLQAAGMWGSESFYQQAAASVGETWP